MSNFNYYNDKKKNNNNKTNLIIICVIIYTLGVIGFYCYHLLNKNSSNNTSKNTNNITNAKIANKDKNKSAWDLNLIGYKSSPLYFKSC